MKIDSLNFSDIESILKTHTPVPEGNYSVSSVMILLFPQKDGLYVLFTQRSLNLKHQPGDICFPGGRKENAETSLETALRETWEEIGIPPQEIQILGQPDFLLTPSGKLILPFLGFVPNFAFERCNANPEEVADIFLIPFHFFLETEPLTASISYSPTLPENFPYNLIKDGKNYNWGITHYPQYFYQYDSYVIWGITAKIMHNVVSILSKHLEDSVP